MDEIHVHKTKKSICAHFAESPCILIKTPPKNLAVMVEFCVIFYFSAWFEIKDKSNVSDRSNHFLTWCKEFKDFHMSKFKK